MYYQNEAEKKQRQKLIAVATIAVSIIVLLIVAIIVVAIKKSSHSDEIVSGSIAEPQEVESHEEGGKVLDSLSASESKTDSDSDKNNQKPTSSGLGLISSEIASNGTSSSSSSHDTDSEDENPVELPADDNLPTTGPQDVLPIAIMAGLLTTCVSSAVLAKREQ